MKGIFLDDNMSNLTTSASNEAVSLSSSSNRNEIGTMYPPPQMHQSFGSVPITTNNQTQSNKKKRNLPGNPDPEAEVVALSPKSLMATNRFICEICNKGFQRDQNLQLHRRGHNLPWKLKQKSKLEVVRKKVYVCPEPSCVHHEPSRALGDLTGIKKHFSRKHGEKKWKCDKCSKRYAVQSDWKAHSKICGTREYRCDCGTLFSRRDSFITHRAFCDALAEETGRSSSLLSGLNHHHLPLHLPINFPLKTEQQQQQHLNFLQVVHPPSFKVGSSTSSPHHQLPSWLDHSQQQQQQQNHPNNSNSQLHQLLVPSPAACSSSTHMTSATALLQRAAQMGVTMSNSNSASTTTAAAAAIILNGSHQLALQQQHDVDYMCAPPAALLSSHHHHPTSSSSAVSSLSASDNNINHRHHVMLEPNSSTANGSCMDQLLLLQPNSNLTTSTSVVGSAAANNIHELIFNSSMLKKDHNINSYLQEEHHVFPQAEASKESRIRKDGGKLQDDELTRDFLGLRGLINHKNNIPMTTDHHFLDVQQLQAGNFDHMNSKFHNQNQIPWQG